MNELKPLGVIISADRYYKGIHTKDAYKLLGHL